MSTGTPDDVRGALIAATESLCAELDPGSVSMRRIAAKTGVSLGLSYYYFDSRQALFGATLSEIAGHIDAAAASEETPEAMAGVVMDVLKERPAFPRILASMALSGLDATESMGEHPFLARLMGMAAEGRPEGITHAGVVVSVLLGSGLYSETVNRAVGRDINDDQIHHAIKTAIMDLLRTDKE